MVKFSIELPTNCVQFKIADVGGGTGQKYRCDIETGMFGKEFGFGNTMHEAYHNCIEKRERQRR